MSKLIERFFGGAPSPDLVREIEQRIAIAKEQWKRIEVVESDRAELASYRCVHGAEVVVRDAIDGIVRVMYGRAVLDSTLLRWEKRPIEGKRPIEVMAGMIASAESYSMEPSTAARDALDEAIGALACEALLLAQESGFSPSVAAAHGEYLATAMQRQVNPLADGPAASLASLASMAARAIHGYVTTTSESESDVRLYLAAAFGFGLARGATLLLSHVLTAAMEEAERVAISMGAA